MVAPGHGIGRGFGLAALPPWNPQILWYGSALAAALLLGAVVIWAVDRWRRKKPDFRVNPNEQLAHFRKLYELGELSAEDFARIRALLTERMIQEIEPPEPAEPPSPGPPPPQGPRP